MQFQAHWIVTIIAVFFYGIGQVVIINCTQNYYTDAFEAAGAVFRSVVGGVAPVLEPSLFKSTGYGWRISVFGFLGLMLAPASLLFYRFGERIRRRFTVDL